MARTGMAVLLFLCPLLVSGGCPFQNPFWFHDKPVVVNVYDERRDVMADRLRVVWGRMENFKCVDYFQIEYFQRRNPRDTVALTPRINRHRRSFEIEVEPCIEYFFKVIASEDWKGLREDFKVSSEVVRFTVAYTPKFVNPPTVKERGRSPQIAADQTLSLVAAINGGGEEGYHDVFVKPPENYTIKVGWRLSDIDHPNCLDHVELDYFDVSYNTSTFLKRFDQPFRGRFDASFRSTNFPCEPDHEFIVRAYGTNKKFSVSDWTPPACMRTTPPPTTTTETSSTAAAYDDAGPTTENLVEKMEAVQDENDKLQAKIDGLKQEYEKIGFQVFTAFKKSLFHDLEDFLSMKKAGDAASKDGSTKANSSEPLFT